MTNKYQRKPMVEMTTRTYEMTCIRCGKVKTVTEKIAVNSPRPIPNPTGYVGEPSWLGCATGQHHFYPSDSLEPKS